MVFKLLLMSAIAFVGALASAKPAPDPCPLTSKSREWLAACFETGKAGRQVKREYRNKLVFDRKGFATIVIDTPSELVAVNTRGKIVELKETHLARFDFEPGDLGQIARFGYAVGKQRGAIQFKCGYYRVGLFQVLVAPVYDQCDDFNRGSALVCIGCVSHCPSGDCHETDFVGGEGIVINDKNEMIRRFALPSIPRCSHDNNQSTEEKPCRPRPPDPFRLVD